MAIRALVMSPLHNLGSTAVSVLIAHGVTFFGKSSLLMYTDAQSPIPRYLSLEEVNDPTRSVVQAEELLRQQALNVDDVLQYTHDYGKNAHVLHTAVAGITEQARARMVSYFMNHTPTDVVVVDNSADVTEDATLALLENTDLVFIVSNNSIKSKTRVRQWLTSSVLKDRQDVFIINNMYDEVIGAMRPLSKDYGVTPNRLCKIHYNPWIANMCNVGHLQDVVPFAFAWDPRTANLNGDLNEIRQCFDSVLFTGRRK